MNKRRICIISSTRADYGILSNLIMQLKKRKNFSTKLVVTGAHLSKKFGKTLKEIKKDRITIDEKAQIKFDKNNEINIAKSSSEAILEFSRIYKKLNPDLIIILGDRFEIFCASYCAVIFRIPVCHFHGGELTLNSYDDYFRHAITKLSSIHFAATNIYKKRILQMGENLKRVFNIGSIGLENIHKIKFLEKKDLEKKLKIKFNKKIVLFTLHPETLKPKEANKQIAISLNALGKLKDSSIIITMPNNDLASDTINTAIKNFCKNKNNAHYFKSLGRKIYLSCMKISDVVVGNSSSGVIEAPSMKKYSIDIGKRQKGREKAQSVLECDFDTIKIHNLINKIFNKKIKKSFKNPYYKKGAIDRTINILKKIDLSKIHFKQFNDLENYYGK